MGIEELVIWFRELASWTRLVVDILGTMVIFGSIYVKLTPNQKDDAWFLRMERHSFYGQLLFVLRRFSVFRRKKI